MFSWGALVGWPAVTASRIACAAAVAGQHLLGDRLRTLYAIQIVKTTNCGGEVERRALGGNAQIGVGVFYLIALAARGQAIERPARTGSPCWRCSPPRPSR